MNDVVIRPNGSISQIREWLKSLPYQSAVPWNYTISLEHAAKKFLPKKIDATFYQQSLLERDSVQHCREHTKIPIVVFVGTATNFGKYKMGEEWHYKKVRERIDQTPEFKTYVKLKRMGVHALFVPSNIEHAQVLRKAHLPYRVPPNSLEMPIASISRACFGSFADSWVAGYLDLEKVISWNARQKMVPSVSGGLKTFNLPIMDSVEFWTSLHQSFYWYLSKFSKVPSYELRLRANMQQKLHVKQFNLKKYYVKMLCPGVTLATIPFWIECDEALEYLLEI